MPSSIIVDLDSILDTRLALIFMMDKDYVGKLLADNRYFKRDSNLFEGIDYEAFMDHYERRNKGLLVNAVATKMVSFIAEYVTKIEEARDRSVPDIDELEVHINTHPYSTLNDNELTAIVRGTSAKLMAEGMPRTTVVKTVSYTPEQLTPKLMNDNYAVVIMYEYYKLLDVQARLKNFDKSSCPSVTLFAPAINVKPHINPPERVKEVEEELNTGLKVKLSIYRHIELDYEMSINLTFLPIELFSIHDDLLR